jgi:hypothetical protein
MEMFPGGGKDSEEFALKRMQALGRAHAPR